MKMWMWRMMIKINWTERKSNESVLEEIGGRRSLMNNIVEKKSIGL